MLIVNFRFQNINNKQTVEETFYVAGKSIICGVRNITRCENVQKEQEEDPHVALMHNTIIVEYFKKCKKKY